MDVAQDTWDGFYLCFSYDCICVVHMIEQVLSFEFFSMSKSYHYFHRYLEQDHQRHCVPSNVSSGLATLPLDHVWVDGKENKSWPTNKMLPTGEMLDGKMAYANWIMPYFTTNEMKPDQVFELGLKQLKKLYPQVSTR